VVAGARIFSRLANSRRRIEWGNSPTQGRTMRDKQLYAQILGIASPWTVTDVELDLPGGEVRVRIEHDRSSALECPVCGAACPGYDCRERRWRHLDTCQYKTILIAQVPRVKCKEHGVVQVRVPWSEPGSRFTAMFEALVIDWLKEASTDAVARLMGLGWKAIDGIMQRAVDWGLERRKIQPPKQLNVDETSFRKRHDYVTIVSDPAEGCVLHVGMGREKKDLQEYYDTLTEEERIALESVAMDMWKGYIGATKKSIPDAELKICFDKFHVAKYLGDAVDKVRREENRRLCAEGDDSLKGTRYRWLVNPENMDREAWRRFKALRESSLKTARAWAIKEMAMSLWNYKTGIWAEKAWKRWLSWALRSRLEPVRKVARMIRTHLYGIINAIVLKVSNGPAESINSRIRTIKTRSRGFRNKERFARSIYFHLGKLDLYPAGIAR
jgi:transposase